MFEDSTTELENVLQDIETKDIDRLMKEQTVDGQAFRNYMRDKLEEKGITQRTLFQLANMPDEYSYKLISGEKKPHRDYVLRFCYAGRFTLKEANRALKLCGLPGLYPKLRRDMVLIIGFNKNMDVYQVNDLLKKYDMEPLKNLNGMEE